MTSKNTKQIFNRFAVRDFQNVNWKRTKTRFQNPAKHFNLLQLTNIFHGC